jgi:hypothetical protein
MDIDCATPFIVGLTNLWKTISTPIKVVNNHVKLCFGLVFHTKIYENTSDYSF